LKNIDFYEEKYGQGSYRDWHYNQTHKFLFGITGKQLVLLPWEEFDGGVSCMTKNYSDIDTTFKYTLYANTTDCLAKTQNLEKIIPDLTMCSCETSFNVKVNGVLLGQPVGKGNFFIISKLLFSLLESLSF
jgi:hypothetical protein